MEIIRKDQEDREKARKEKAEELATKLMEEENRIREEGTLKKGGQKLEENSRGGSDENEKDELSKNS